MMENNENYRLVDVRSRQDYEKEHIKGAISLPLDELDRKASSSLRLDDRIITYCDSFICSSSTSGAKMLARKGFTDVRDYKGGLREWKQAGYPTEGNLVR